MGAGPRVACWGGGGGLGFSPPFPSPQAPPATPRLPKAGDRRVPSRFHPLTHSVLSSLRLPSITTALWWRRLRLRACPPASRSPSSAPGKSPPCRTPGTGSHPAPQHLGNLGGAGHFRPSATQRRDSPGEGSRTGPLGDGVSRPWALQGRGGGWTETSAFKSFVSKLWCLEATRASSWQ